MRIIAINLNGIRSAANKWFAVAANPAVRNVGEDVALTLKQLAVSHKRSALLKSLKTTHASH